MDIKEIKDNRHDKGEMEFVFIVKREKLEEQMKKEFKKNKEYFNIPGFRKGKAPYEIVAKMYGENIFLSDAIEAIAFGECTEEINEKLEKEKDLNNLGIINVDIDEKDLEKGKDVKVTIKVAVVSTLELKKLDKIEVKEKEINEKLMDVKEEAKKQIERDLEQNSSKELSEDKEYKVKDGDEVVLSFKGSIKNDKGEDEYFEGGTAERFNLVIGSHSFIDNFEEQLIGLKAHDKKDVLVTFPEEYAEKSLQGKKAKFEVEIFEIYITKKPELDDEFAKDLGYDNLKEYKKHVEEHLNEHNEENKKNIMLQKAVEFLAKENNINVSEKYLEFRAKSDFDRTNEQYKMQGFDLAQLMSPEDLKQVLKESEENIKREVQTQIVLESIIKMEDIKCDEKEMLESLDEYNKMYGTNVTKKEIKEKEYKELKENMEKAGQIKKAINTLVDLVKVK